MALQLRPGAPTLQAASRRRNPKGTGGLRPDTAVSRRQRCARHRFLMVSCLGLRKTPVRDPLYFFNGLLELPEVPAGEQYPYGCTVEE